MYVNLIARVLDAERCPSDVLRLHFLEVGSSRPSQHDNKILAPFVRCNVYKHLSYYVVVRTCFRLHLVTFSCFMFCILDDSVFPLAPTYLQLLCFLYSS